MSDWFPPQEPDYGDDCVHCWLAGFTPRVLGIVFSGIERGALWLPAYGQPPNGSFLMTQDLIKPCEWLADLAPDWYAAYNTTDVNSATVFRRTFFVFPFFSLNNPPCTEFFLNDAAVPAGNTFYGGQCQVIPLWEVPDPVEDVTPIVDPDPLFKTVPRSDGKSVVSYIDRWGDTKIKLLVDHTLR